MATWIVACLGVITAAYFAAEVIGSMNFEEAVFRKGDHSFLYVNKFRRIFFTSLYAIEGFSRQRSLRRDIFIPLDTMDHFEICKGELGVMGWGVTDVYYFLALDGRTVKVNDRSQNVLTLLNKIATY
jgi:hypothetical protein